MNVSVIFSSLALLAAIVCLVKIGQEKKRSKKRNTALVRYIEREAKAAERTAGYYTEEQVKMILEQIEGRGKILDRISTLEKGIAPDYEAAKKAADAVNNFSKGISNILGYDPMDVLKAERQKGMGDAE